MYGNMYVWVNEILRKHCWRSRGGGWGDVGVMYAMALWCGITVVLAVA
ncbi:hypothetical protein [Bartonella grahamii]|nr:hypothetical protein [Bartonella grahamii]